MRRRPRPFPAGPVAPVAAAFLALACAAPWSATALGAGRTAVPGAAVELEPPETFIVAPDGSALVDLGAGARIEAVETDLPVGTTLDGLTPDALRPRGVELLASAPVASGLGEAVLHHVRQGAEGERVERWMLVAGDATGTLVLTATLPGGASPEAEEAVRAALLGATRAGAAVSEAGQE